MTTHIRVSSTCTPTPLVFAFDVFLVRVAGRMKSPGGACTRLGLYWSESLEGALAGSVEPILQESYAADAAEISSRERRGIQNDRASCLEAQMQLRDVPDSQ